MNSPAQEDVDAPEAILKWLLEQNTCEFCNGANEVKSYAYCRVTVQAGHTKRHTKSWRMCRECAVKNDVYPHGTYFYMPCVPLFVTPAVADIEPAFAPQYVRTRPADLQRFANQPALKGPSA